MQMQGLIILMEETAKLSSHEDSFARLYKLQGDPVVSHSNLPDHPAGIFASM